MNCCNPRNKHIPYFPHPLHPFSLGFCHSFSILFKPFWLIHTLHLHGNTKENAECLFPFQHFLDNGKIATNSILFLLTFSILFPCFLHVILFGNKPAFHCIYMVFPWYIPKHNFNTMEKPAQNVCCVTINRPLNMVFPC